MDKQPIDPKIESGARAIYGLILSGKDEDARDRLIGMGAKKLEVAGALIRANCRWPAGVVQLLDGASCLLLFVSGLVVSGEASKARRRNNRT